MNDNLKQVAGAISLRDQLYGITEGRQAARQAARDTFVAAKEEGLQGQRIAAEEKQLQTRLTADESQFTRRLGFEREMKTEELGVRKEEHKANMDFNYAQLKAQKAHYATLESQNKFGNEIALKNLGLRQQEIDALKENRKVIAEQKQQQYAQKEVANTQNYIANLERTRDKKGNYTFETQGSIFFAKLKLAAMSGLSGEQSLMEVPQQTTVWDKIAGNPSKGVINGYTHVIIAPGNDPKGRWQQGDVLGVNNGKVDTKPLMPNPAKNETSMSILLNKMPGYKMTQADYEAGIEADLGIK